MRSFWQRWRDPLGLYARLEARRSKPRPEFVRQLSDELGESRQRARTPLRLALAGALTLMMLAAAGTVGAAGYASSAAASVANAVTNVGSGGDQAIVLARHDDDDDGGGGGRGGDDDDDDDGPDDDQYEEEQEECEGAVREAHQDFHAGLGSDHRLFHLQQNVGRLAHRLFHRQQNSADREQHQLLETALEECESIGGGGNDDDDDDDDD